MLSSDMKYMMFFGLLYRKSTN